MVFTSQSLILTKVKTNQKRKNYDRPIGAELTPLYFNGTLQTQREPPTSIVNNVKMDGFHFSISNINQSQNQPKTHILR
jgi:hypothetical protein